MYADDEDAINAFEREAVINARIASLGGIRGAAEFLGTLDLSAVDASLLPAAVGGRTALVWRQVEGKTIDTYFDRLGGMSPMLAKTLDVRASEPVKLPSGELSYIKKNLAVKVTGELLPCLPPSLPPSLPHSLSRSLTLSRSLSVNTGDGRGSAHSCGAA